MKALPKGYSVYQISPSLIIHQLYDTQIVTIDYYEDTITIRTGGWKTKHTKKCINLALRGFGIYIKQKDYEWYVIRKSLELPMGSKLIIRGTLKLASQDQID